MIIALYNKNKVQQNTPFLILISEIRLKIFDDELSIKFVEFVMYGFYMSLQIILSSKSFIAH